MPPQSSSLPFHVYLSHAHEDFLLVDRVWRVLDHMGLRAYMYEHYPHHGRAVCEAVTGALRDSAEVAVFLTEAGAASAWVHQELGATLAMGKAILPVVQVNAVQVPGFTDLRQPILYDPTRPEAAISRLLWLLRVDFELFEGPLTVECPSCKTYFEVALPALQSVRRAMDANRLLDRYACRQCETSVYLSPWTLEPISEQMALGRAWPD